MTAAAAALPRQVVTSHGIGGSEIAAALGLNAYKTPLELWLEKTGQAPGFEGNDRTEWGLDVEPSLRNWYVRRHNLAVLVPTESMYHEEHSWMRATPDGIALRENPAEREVYWDHGFEAKNVGRHSAHRWGEPGTDQVPIEYLLQAQQGMAVTELKRWVIVACIAGDPPAEYPIERDDELIGQIIDGGAAFWRLVEAGTPPEIDGSEAYSVYLAERYPFSREDYRQADAEAERNVAALRDVRATLRELEQREATLSNLIKAAIGENAGLATSLGRLTWKPQRGRELIDWEAIAVNLAAEYGVSEKQLQARIAANTSQAKGSRPLRLPRSWSTDSKEG